MWPFINTLFRSNRRRPSRAKKTINVCSSMERLEERRLLTGNVSVQILNNNLFITGDNSGNAIDIYQLNNGNFRIQSSDRGATLVNRKPSVDVSGSFQDMIVNLNGGNDQIRLHDATVNRSVVLNLGAGVDRADVDDVMVGADLSLSFGSGTGVEAATIKNSRIGSSSSSNNDLRIVGGVGTQSVELSNLVIEDDLFVDLTGSDKDQQDVIHFSQIDVLGESSGALARLRAGNISGDHLLSSTDIDMAFVGNADVWNLTAGDDITIQGRNVATQSDSLTVHADAVGDQFVIRGLAGNDTIEVSGQQNARLEGGAGNDTLIGADGNDELFGGDGFDQLFGNGGNDWMEAGTAAELASGGMGTNWNAHRFDVNGASFDDINQTQTPTCVLLATLSSVAIKEGSDFLLDKIKYLGNFQYEVQLFDDFGNAANQVITFDGTLFGWEPTIAADTESWVILIQRAYLQLRGFDYTSQEQAMLKAGETGGTIGSVLTMVTGRPSSTYFTAFPGVDPSAIQNAVSQGKNVLVGTKGAGLVKDSLINNHAYTVVGSSLIFNVIKNRWEGSVTLRNPWGIDGGTSTGDASDGIVVIDIATLWASISVVVTN